jgi:hypothetical protein
MDAEDQFDLDRPEMLEVLIEHRRIQHMSAPRKSDQEFRRRAVGCIGERLAEPASRSGVPGAMSGVLLDLKSGDVRNWARNGTGSNRTQPGAMRESEEVRHCGGGGRVLERANEILKTSAAYWVIGVSTGLVRSLRTPVVALVGALAFSGGVSRWVEGWANSMVVTKKVQDSQIVLVVAVEVDGRAQ